MKIGLFCGALSGEALLKNRFMDADQSEARARLENGERKLESVEELQSLPTCMPTAGDDETKLAQMRTLGGFS